jgi:polyhydroxyalkanoate synthesis regulator phasin
MHTTIERFHTISRWLQAGVMAMAVGLSPLAVAAAGDHEAVGKRLADAVAQGELTQAEASAMMDTLRRVAERERREREGGESDRDTLRMTAAEREVLGEMRDHLDDAVRRGEMTREQADEAHRGLQERMAKRRSSDSDHSSKSKRSRRSARDADRSSDSDRDSDRDSDSDSDRSSQSNRDSNSSSQSSRDSSSSSSRDSSRSSSRDSDRSRNSSRSRNSDRARDGAGSRDSDRSGRSDSRASGERDFDWGRVVERIEAAVGRGDITRRDAEAMYRVLRAPRSDRKR